MMVFDEDRVFSADRLRIYGAAILALYVAGFAQLIAGGLWPVHSDGDPTFVDFIWIWTGARMASTGTGLAAYDYAAFSALQAPMVSASRGAFPYYHFPYPPQTLLFLAPLGWLPYFIAWLAWVGATGAIYLAALQQIVPGRMTIFIALLPITVPMGIYSGHTGFLLAGLLALTLAYTTTRPGLAGVFLGILTYKPPYGPLFPLVLLLGRHWCMLFSAIATTIALGLMTSWAFGIEIWSAYRAVVGNTNIYNFTTDVELDALIQTVFGVAHWLGADLSTKWSAHLAVAVPVAALVCVVWCGSGPYALKAATLGIGVLAVTPYMLAYDLTTLAVPTAFIIRDGLDRGFLRGERWGLLGCFLALFLSLGFPVAPFILAVLLALVLRRLRAGQFNACLPSRSRG